MFLARRFYQFVAGQPSSCVLFALCGVLLAFCPRSGPHSDRKVTISRETTYLVEPLRPTDTSITARRSTRGWAKV